jgi:tetratricopeptide (TPR) repeat protein
MEQTTERFLLVETIVTEMLDAPKELRVDLIEARCGADPTLAGEVRLLLDACDAEEELMALCRLEPRAVKDERPESKLVGPYEIDRLLGRGGMGAVYLAHRADGHFEQKVAIKLIDRPFATDLFRERFRQERQILAGLQHPYIARLLDGGVTAEGELYLVMEYVDGVPIHRYCEERRLTQTQRIELFLRACEAVQFAHQNFVVHRDLKPDNILVVEDGTPRLLDFGTAKLLSPSLEGQESQLTREGYLSFTPQYASPEQVLGNPITTASDTYSLGVLLYLLLTGTPPYEFKQLATGEMLRVVCEEAPRRPSATIDGKRLDADLEAILLKALRKEPQERYLTAERLGDDLRAWLDGQPVAARRGTIRYLAGKFVRRHRLALAAAAMLVATLIAGIAGVGWQARVANQERRVANEERRKAEARSADLRQLSNSLLTELDEAIQQIPGSTGAQKVLVTSVLRHLDRMAQDAHGDRQTQLDLASAYTRLANLQGNDYDQNLGDVPGALASIDKAIALGAPFAGSNSRDREAIHALAFAQSSRGEILFGTAPIQQAIASTKAATEAYERLIDFPGITTTELCDAARTSTLMGDELGLAGAESQNDRLGAIYAYRRGVELYKRASSIDPRLVRAIRGLALGQVRIAETEMGVDPEQALKDLRVGVQYLTTVPSEEQGILAIVRLREHLLLDEANALAELGDYSKANSLEVGLLQSFQHYVAADPQDLRALEDLHAGLDQEVRDFETAADPALGASAHERRRNLAAAEQPLTQDVAVMEAILKRDPSKDELKPFLANRKVHLGAIQFILHSKDDSIGLAKRGLADLRNLAENNQNSPTFLSLAADGFLIAEPASLKDPQLAVLCAERAVDLSHRKLPSRLLTLAQAYRADGQSEKSRATAKEGLALLPVPQPGSVNPRIRKLLEMLAGIQS